MRLRYSADLRTLFWTLVLTPGVVALQYARPDWVPYLSWLSFYFALSCGVIAHNHLHSPTFTSKLWNEAFGNWISIFYGYPTFAWIPTHNLNHHKFVNKAGDATITWRYTNRRNFFITLTYPFVSGYFQSVPTKAFLRKAKERNPSMWRRILLQYCIVFGSHAALLGLAVGLHGLETGLYVWGFSLGLPGLFALWGIMVFNYEQHVHTDPWSEYNHSRNFVGPGVRFFLFNNGFHGAHHEQAGLHWSLLPGLHAKFGPHVDPRLIERNLFWYFFREYALALLIPSLGSKQIGRAPFDPPQGRLESLAIADVDLGEAGTNAQRV